MKVVGYDGINGILDLAGTESEISNLPTNFPFEIDGRIFNYINSTSSFMVLDTKPNKMIFYNVETNEWR